jgi:hypothetical protein
MPSEFNPGPHPNATCIAEQLRPGMLVIDYAYDVVILVIAVTHTVEFNIKYVDFRCLREDRHGIIKKEVTSASRREFKILRSLTEDV